MAIKTDYDIINLLTKVIELDENSHESNVLMLFALRAYLFHIEKMYETMNEDKDSMFFFYAHDTPELKEYFNGLYAKVYDQSREEIMKITTKLQEGFAKAREIKSNPYLPVQTHG